MEPKKLYRSSTNKMICGVCQGVAEYINIDFISGNLGNTSLINLLKSKGKFYDID